MEKNGTDPIDRLLVDKEEIDKERIADILEGIVGIDNKTGEVVKMSDFNKLNTTEQLCVVLLARKAAVLADKLDKGDEAITHGKLADILRSSNATVRQYVTKYDFVQSDKNKGYYIPNSSVSDAVDYLEKKWED